MKRWRYEEATKTIRSIPENHWIASMDSFDGAENHAYNAKLIALAPELLEALRLAVQYVGRGVVEGAYNNCVVSGEKALAKIEATLRKADGRRN